MKRKNDVEFKALLEDEEFIRILNAEEHLSEKYLADLSRENPDKEEGIRDAADFVRHYRLKQVVDLQTINKMWQSVLKRSGQGKEHPLFRIGTLLKIAASVVIVVSLGFYIHSRLQGDMLRQVAEKQVAVGDEARIIISNGEEFKLKEDGSNIRYGAEGKKIFIEEKGHKAEMLANYSEKTGPVFNQIIVPYGRRHSLILSDGTTVQLNSGSKLVFPAKFSGTRREVYLKGEGYFAVTKNKNMPFIVKTDYMNIEVLGTRFNVSAYENENSASAILVKGSIEVYTNNFLKKDRRKIIPGQGCFYSGVTSDFSIREVDVNEYVSWIDGMIQFKGQPFIQIVEKIEKYYNISINIKDDELAKRLISGKLVLCNDVEETMAYMARTTKSRYYYEDGTYIFAK